MTQIRALSQRSPQLPQFPQLPPTTDSLLGVATSSRLAFSDKSWKVIKPLLNHQPPQAGVRVNTRNTNTNTNTVSVAPKQSVTSVAPTDTGSVRAVNTTNTVHRVTPKQTTSKAAPIASTQTTSSSHQPVRRCRHPPAAKAVLSKHGVIHEQKSQPSGNANDEDRDQYAGRTLGGNLTGGP